MGKLLISTYFAAGFSFLFTAIRDLTIISETTYAESFFEIIYFSSIASGFVINAITLNAHAPTLRFCVIATATSIGLVLITGSLYFYKPLDFLAVVSLIIFLWIIGAIASRSLLVVGHVFIGRIREGVASLITIPLVLLGFDLLSTLIIAIFTSTCWLLWVSRNHTRSYFSHWGIKTKTPQYEAIFITNLASMAMLSWALYFNQYSNDLFGQESTIAVRMAVYSFQAFSIGSVVMVTRMPNLAKEIRRLSLQVCFSSLALGFAVSIVSPSFGVLLMPLLAALSHYSGVVYIHRERLMINDKVSGDG